MNNENDKKATIYGKSNCNFCDLAKKVLTTNGYEINYVNLDDDAKRKEFYELTTKELGGPVMSVPQIWIGDSYIGGYTSLLKYIESVRSIQTFHNDF